MGWKRPLEKQVLGEGTNLERFTLKDFFMYVTKLNKKNKTEWRKGRVGKVQAEKIFM